MTRTIKILLLEDSFTDAELLMHTLSKAGIDHILHWAETKQHFLSELYNFKPDIILSDHALPGGFNSLEALRISREHDPDVAFILVTGATSEEFAVECMKAGVDDYIMKDSLVRLPASIRTILSKASVQREKREVEHLHARLKVAYNRIEESNKSITDSLNYARLIQQSILPDHGLLDDFFSGSFIIYKPKDIVSGDFYWFYRKNDTLVMAVADCTGHGVPGALMSMIGNALLNEVVGTKGIHSPSEILGRLHSGIRRALRQNPDSERSDGMDIAICRICREERKLEFAGANRHLVLVPKGKPLEMIKGDKRGLGGLYASEFPVTFANHSFTYGPGDVIYLFTDGYADQFGGARGKRMMTKNMLRILERSLSFGIAEQERVLSYWLERWRRGLEQTDDILLLGAVF